MTPYEGSFESAATEVARTISKSVEASVRGQSKVAVGFSGGLDSSILATCAKRFTTVLACSAWSPGSIDERKASESAREIGVEIIETRLTVDAVRGALDEMRLPFEPTEMDKALWSLYYLTSKRAGEAGAGEILLGQLSDELFGGYAKYERALENGSARAEQTMNADVAEYPKRGRLRDVSACERWLPARFPFEAKEVVELGQALPVAYKISEGTRKAVLRRAALMLGLPEGLATVPKKAAQYSSGIQKLIADHAL